MRGREGVKRQSRLRYLARIVRVYARPSTGPLSFWYERPEINERSFGGDEYFMCEALRLANKAAVAGEVPIGAIVVRAGKIIGRAYNQVELLKDATAHAEMLALTQAEAAVGDWRLTDCDLYVTKEPCAMCAGALVHTRIRRVIFGCTDPSAGAAGSVINLLQMPGFNHQCDIASGVLQNECAAILRDFFRKRREERDPGSV